MTDTTTGILYDIFVLSIIVIFHFIALFFSKSCVLSISSTIDGKKSPKGISVLLGLFTVFPVAVGVLMSPDPAIYTQFAYFNVDANMNNILLYRYHTNYMQPCVYISFFSTIGAYYLSTSKIKVQYAIPVIIITWINGKRTLLLFLLIAFLIIDYLRWDKEDRKYIRNFILKLLLFCITYIIYYIIYNYLTKKADYADWFVLYTTYFSRLSNVKVAIYDQLYTHSILDFPFQNLLYDLLFFIPRSIWPTKPYGYYPYYTSYVFIGQGTGMDPGYGFQVNLWSEYISNAGIIGIILAIVLILSVVRISESASNPFTYLLGSAFVILYFAYGFEHLVQILWVSFLGSLLLFWVTKRPRFVKAQVSTSHAIVVFDKQTARITENESRYYD